MSRPERKPRRRWKRHAGAREVVGGKRLGAVGMDLGLVAGTSSGSVGGVGALVGWWEGIGRGFGWVLGRVALGGVLGRGDWDMALWALQGIGRGFRSGGAKGIESGFGWAFGRGSEVPVGVGWGGLLGTASALVLGVRWSWGV